MVQQLGLGCGDTAEQSVYKTPKVSEGSREIFWQLAEDTNLPLEKTNSPVVFFQ